MSKIVNLQESKKNIVIEGLKKCLHSLAGYDLNSLMPLLYVLCGHHKGHRTLIVFDDTDSIFAGEAHIQTVDEEESPLLKEIRSSVKDSSFSGPNAEIIYDFYSTYCDYINDFYQDMIEYIIDYSTMRLGKYSGMTATPKEIAQLMGFLISQQQPHAVYDPCAGLCSFAMLPELNNVRFKGSEINSLIKIIADVRLDAAGKKITLEQEDSTTNWGAASDCDCLASELPFGVRVNDNTRSNHRPYFLEDHVISQFLESSTIQSAVLLVSVSTCYRRENFDLRKTLCEKNYVDAVIKLPNGILPCAGIPSVILILNKNRDTKDVTFVYTADCLISDMKHRKLDYKQVINRLQNTDNEQTCSVNVGETFKHDCDLTPNLYITKMIEVEPGQKLVKLTEIAKIIRGERNFADTEGRVLQREDLCEKVTDIHTRENTIESTKLDNSHRQLRKIEGKCVIFNISADKFYYKNDNEALFVNPNYTCFEVNEEKCAPEYFIHIVIDNPQVVSNFMHGAGMQRANFSSMLLPFYEDTESQKN